MPMTRISLVFAATLALSACVATTNTFKSVSISSSGSGGHAHKHVEADGTMDGGHMSGSRGGAPMVHLSQGKMPADDLARLNRLAADLPETAPPAACGGSKRQLDIEHAGKRRSFVACGGAPFASPVMEEIYGLLGKQRVGGW